MILDELLESAARGVGHQTREMGDGWITRDCDGQLVCEVPRGDSPALRSGIHPLRQIRARDAITGREGVYLLLFGRQPVHVRMAQDIVEHHDLARNERGARLAAITVVPLP